jgi:hypothetical protein
MKKDDAADRPLDESQWRAFRLFLSTLSDGAFNTACRQLDQEIRARAKSEANALRLFYSSLTYDDLQIARREIVFLSAPFPKLKRTKAAGTRPPPTRKPRA